MSERINVLGIEINNYTAKEAMQRVVTYAKDDSLQVVARVTPETVKNLSNDLDGKAQMESYEITFPGNRVMLEVAGIEEKQLLKEAEDQTFIKLFARFLHKNEKKVFLLAETKASNLEMQEYISQKLSRITIVGNATFEEHGNSADMIVNSVNSTEVDCVIAAISSPMQEEFIARYRAALNAKIWLGLGTKFEMKQSSFTVKKIKNFVERHVLKKEMKNVDKS